MLRSESIVNIIDNSGAKTGKCIKILTPVSSTGYKVAQVGDIIMVSLQKVLPDKKIKKGGKYKALIVSTKAPVKRAIGHIKFNKNAVILLNKNDEPFGTRLNSYIVKEIREKHFSKIVSLAVGLV